MNKEELAEKIEEWEVEEVIVLEPQEDFNCGIIGITEDKCHLVYSYEKLTEGMAQKNYENRPYGDKRLFEDFLNEACEWVDYNTIRQLPYMSATSRPIIIYEFQGEGKWNGKKR